MGLRTDRLGEGEGGDGTRWPDSVTRGMWGPSETGTWGRNGFGGCISKSKTNPRGAGGTWWRRVVLGALTANLLAHP